jgi:hypothetical protein
VTVQIFIAIGNVYSISLLSVLLYAVARGFFSKFKYIMFCSEGVEGLLVALSAAHQILNRVHEFKKEVWSLFTFLYHLMS